MTTQADYVLRSRIRRARKLGNPVEIFSGEIRSTPDDVTDFSVELTDKLEALHGMRGISIGMCIGDHAQNVARHQHLWDANKRIPVHVFGYTGRIYATVTGEPGPAYDPCRLWEQADEKNFDLACNSGRGTKILKENVDFAWCHFDPESHGYVMAFNLRHRPEKQSEKKAT